MENYTEDQALKLMWDFAHKFGWKGVMFTRDYVRQAVIEHYGWSESLDDKVDAVMSGRMWVKDLEEAIATEGMGCIYDAIVETEKDK
jgi:hypothetical protein